MDAAALFETTYGRASRASTRAPGRVNLIGEHLDYTLLPVLPIALQHGVAVAAAPSSTGRIRAVSDRFSEPVDLAVGQSRPPAGWQRYLWAACREAGVADGVDLAICSDLFADGGLSSSSALTVAILGAVSPLTGEALVRAASRAERSVGIEGGLMDQTVIVHGEPGTALRIEFEPWAFRPVQIPAGIKVVAAHSGRVAAKTAAIRDAFDARVAGGRVAAALVADALGRNPAHPPLLGPLASDPDIDEAIAGLPGRMAPRLAPAPVAELVQFTARSLDPDVEVPVRVVAEHVVSEARRVDVVEAALGAADVGAVGDALDASHESLRRYGATTTALDTVCEAMRSAGAAGARMTGAGWGGFAVAVCAPGAVDAVVTAAVRSTGGPAFEVRPSAGMSR